MEFNKVLYQKEWLIPTVEYDALVKKSSTVGGYPNLCRRTLLVTKETNCFVVWIGTEEGEIGFISIKKSKNEAIELGVKLGMGSYERALECIKIWLE